MGEDVPPEYLKQLQNGEGFGDSSGSDVIDETGNSVSDTEAPPEEGDAEGAGQGSSGEAQGTEGAGQETGGDAQGADDSSQGTEEDSQGTEAASPLNQAGEVTEPITKEDKPYLALGANLTQQQQATVLSLLGINPAELSEYDVIYITNEEEHQYLGNYVDAQKIGTRALSSVLIVKREKGNGIRITTKNISYCTIGMYKNALITAGITDLVAGPTPISGTAALVGAMKAYAVMTGEEVTEESMDTALNELVLTGDEHISLLCDHNWMIEAVENVVKNAFDHTEKGNLVWIEWKKSASVVQIIIKDNGSGIQPEDLHHIFKRFYRSRFSKDKQGIGLGLPLAKMIVESHNGTIEVDSTLGAGTAFTMNFLIPTKL
jgi:uncharacterized protein YpuA (DUF1002 family)